MREFKPDFSSTEPLLKFGLTARATETLIWLVQGKTNPDIASILPRSDTALAVFEVVTTRKTLILRAYEIADSN